MKNFFNTKNFSGGLIDLSENDRRVKVAISQMGSKDLDGDVIDSSAYTKTLNERGPKAKNQIWHLTDHNPSLKSAVGKFSELYVEGDMLVGVTNIPNTTWGNDVLEFYKSGHITEHSIGFRTIKEETKSDYNLIKEVMLYEGSAVLWGANPNTPTLSAGKSITKEEANSELEQLNKDLELVTKTLRNGNLSDESFELVEMRLQMLNERIKNLFAAIQQQNETIQPAEAIVPDYAKEMQLIDNILKLF
jgi:HK97 family phage prohead protease